MGGRRWTSDELEALVGAAGQVPVHAIAVSTGRTVAAIRHKASVVGVSVRVGGPVWCIGCSAWRTAVDEDGRCPVCRMRALADAMEERWRLEPASDAPSAVPMVKRPPMGVVRAEEAAEVERHRARYNAAKMRLSRARRAAR